MSSFVAIGMVGGEMGLTEPAAGVGCRTTEAVRIRLDETEKTWVDSGLIASQMRPLTRCTTRGCALHQTAVDVVDSLHDSFVSKSAGTKRTTARVHFHRLKI